MTLMISGRTALILLAMSLEIILRRVLLEEIGLDSLTLERLGSLGTRARW